MPDPANIGPRGARRRALQGMTALLLTATLLVLYVTDVVGQVWLAPFALLLWLGSLGVFQARART